MPRLGCAVPGIVMSGEQQVWSTHLSAAAPRVTVAALAVALVVESLAGWMHLRPRPQRAEQVGHDGHAMRLWDPSALLSSHLFGASAPSPGEPVASTLPLALTGTIAFDDPTKGFALIREGQWAERVYAVGAMLPGDAVLERVYATQVVVRRGGSLEYINLPRAKVPGVALRAQRVIPPRPVDRLLERARLIPVDPDPDHPINPPSSPVVRALQVQSVESDRHLLGYKVHATGDGAVFHGLPPDATITAINGVVLSDGVIARRMFDSLASGGEAVFTIIQGEGTTNVTADTSAAAAAAATRPRLGSR